MISGTVSDYNNETLILLEKRLKEYNRLLHNAHDGDKLAVRRDFLHLGVTSLSAPQGVDKQALIDIMKPIIERPITYEGRSLIMTAGIKVYT
jgi:hypothetical protein